ncbi:MAG: NAD-dependent epimerase/dehydratase family protein, partial [Janthinobacterium lividum]
DVLTAAAAAADGVVHMAYGGDFANPEPMMRRDVNAITALGAAMEGTDRALVATSGTLVMPVGQDATETDAADPDGLAPFRVAGEQACMAFVDRGVRASVVRLAPTVHGPRDQGFIPMLIATAKQTGVSAYVGDGTNRWPAVHRDDAAMLFRLTLENAPAGSFLHGVAETVEFRAIAQAIGDGLHLPVHGISNDEALTHFASPFMGLIYGADVPVRSDLTRRLLDWHPTHPRLLDDLASGDYLRGAKG